MSREIFKTDIKTILQRVGRVIGSKSNKDIAEALGVEPQTCSNWKTRASIPWEELFAFCQARKVTFDWLLTGKEPPEPNLLIQTTPRLKTFHRDFAMDNYIPIKLLKDAVAAGSPSEVNDNDIDGWCLIYSDKKWMPGNPEEYTCVKVQGKSMYPILNDGDIVAIDHSQKDPSKLDKKMVAFRKDGGVTIKWLKVLENGQLIVGVPENKDDFDHVISLRGEEINQGVVGKIAWWWAKR